MPPISKEKNQKIKSGVGAQRKSIVLKREGSHSGHIFRRHSPSMKHAT
jgi:peptide methionine sulfoxide reductase MsrB